jgi:RNA polymerase sigma factor (sigma-70 family)
VAAWEELVARERPRIRGWVVGFGFPERPEVRIESDDRDDATQAAVERGLYALVHSFRGTTYDEFRAALRTCTRFACMDFCRRKLVDDRHRAGSLQDERQTGEGEVLGRFDRELADLGRRIEEGRFEQRLDKDRVDRAIGRVPSDDMRRVLRLSLDGHPAREIADALGTSIDNVYQLRSRGQRRLNEILGADD